MIITLRKLHALLLAAAVMLGALGFEALATEPATAALRINPATSNSFKVTRLANAKYRVALDLADRQEGEKVSIKTNRWINGELVFVLIGEAKVGRKGKTAITLSRPIPVGVGIAVATDSKLLIRRRIMQIAGVPSIPAQVAQSPAPTPSPSPTQTIWYDYSPAPAPDITAPTITAVSTAALSGTSASLTFTPSETGTFVHIAKLSTDAAPVLADFDPSSVGVGSGSIATAGAPKTVTVSGLTVDTSYIIYLVIRDAAGNASTIEHGATLITDVTAPTLASVGVASVATNSATLNFTPSEGGLFRYLVQTSGLAPSAEDLFAGMGVGGTATAAISSASITALTGATSYTVYLAHKDSANNFSAVYAVAFTTLADTTLPTLASVSARAATDTSATLRFTPSEAGTFFYIINSNTLKSAVENATTPNISAFNTSTAGISVGTPGSAQAVTLSDLLVVNTYYQIYLVMRDAAGNLSAIQPSGVFLTDVTAPILTGVSVSDLTSTSVRLNFQSNDNGEYKVAVLLTSDTAPTAAYLKDSGAGAGGYGEMDNPKRVDIGGLTSNTSYTAYFVQRDEGGNLSALYSVVFTTL